MRQFAVVNVQHVCELSHDLGINMDMSAYVNNLSTCGLLCGHNFLLSMTRIMKLIFKNFHILWYIV